MHDEFSAYNALKKINYLHLWIDHTKMFCGGDIHVNSVESFWAIVKRAIYGIYNRVSVKYLQSYSYIDEVSFSFNNRYEDEGFDSILKNAVLA